MCLLGCWQLKEAVGQRGNELSLDGSEGPGSMGGVNLKMEVSSLSKGEHVAMVSTISRVDHGGSMRRSQDRIATGEVEANACFSFVCWIFEP